MDDIADLGSYHEVDGRPAVRFERCYPHSIERVWASITEPAELAHWFPSALVELEPRAGGTIRFAGDPYAAASTGTILVWQPPTALAFSWGGDELRFSLQSLGPDRCRLLLLNLLEARNTAARNAGGWHTCLAELAKAIAGRPGPGPHSESVAANWPTIYQAHVAAGLPAGAEIPG